jgi:2-phospho-L-lactate guanylyltransferase
VTALWSVVIPVKGTVMAKSRLGGAPDVRAALALAMALDTVTATLAAETVAEVIVVTSATAGPQFAALGATVVADSGTSLSAAIRAGLVWATAPATGTTNIAVLLGDLPALQSQELDTALALAAQHPLSMVPDATETGTTLLAARAGAGHAPAFGAGSAVAHNARGYVPLDVPASSGLRTDVDTALDLDALAASASPALGQHTRAVLASTR